MTKILYIITKSNWGGAQRYVFDMAVRSAQEKIHGEACSVSVALGGEGPLSDALKTAGIPVIHIPSLGRDVNPIKDFRVLFNLISLLRKERPDIIHVNSSKIGALGALAGRITRVHQIIFTAHGWAFNENRSLTSKLFIKIIYWITIILSHTTIAVSENMRSKTTYWPWIKNKIKVIHNGAETPTYFTKESARVVLSEFSPALASALKNDRNRFWIGTIAELHPTKSLDTAIRALSEVVKTAVGTPSKTTRKPTHKPLYVIIGEGQERAQLEGLIVELGLADTVFLLGHRENAAQYLKAFDLFMLVSVSEGLGYAVIEAGMAGLPVIATGVGGLPELVEDMKSGILIQPKKPLEISHSIEFMLENKSTAREYARTLHTHIKEGFSIETMFEKTFALYKK
jgi:glycosyltransferase involved in cell wall biosynthesis